MNMKRKERDALLYDHLVEKSALKLNDAMELLGISESTVRRLFINLEKSGKAIRTCGGISIIDQNSKEYFFEKLVKSQTEEKKAIGAMASNHVKNKEAIYIDCGTTSFSLCLQLAKQTKREELSDVHIFTNSLANLEVLSPFYKVTLIGGTYRPNRKDFAGYLSEKMLSNIMNLNKSFMGADGFTKTAGFCAMDFDTARLNRIVVPISEEVFVLCDSTKFGKAALANCFETENVNYVITDKNIAPEYVDFFNEKSIKIINV